jgi:hypothetical protein
MEFREFREIRTRRAFTVMKLIKKIINFYVGLEKDKSELLLIFKF